MSTRLRFTVEDLNSFPDDGNLYEVIDGELYVSKAPHYLHQAVMLEVGAAFRIWDTAREQGVILPGAGVLFAIDTGVIPDLVWISEARRRHVLDPDGKLHAAPDIAIEVLSPGAENERRDRETKLKLYSREGVLEYWLFDRERQRVHIYRRVDAVLELVLTLVPGDQLTSPLLPGFVAQVSELFSFPTS